MPNPKPISLSAAVKCWHVYTGEYTPDPEAKHWGTLWEPLRIDAPKDAKPYCCLSRTVLFYDKTGNKRLGEVDHLSISGPHPQLLHISGRWREVVSGRVQWRDDGWYMAWWLADNTEWARKLNGEEDRVSTFLKEDEK